MYELLSKLYYKDLEKYRNEYQKRINSYGTIDLPFQIKPYNFQEEYSCFYVNHPALDLLHEQIFKQSKLIQSIMDDLPRIAINQYIKAKLVDELLSTNEIEGVHSTKAEMETVIEIVVKKDNPKKKVRHLSLMKTYFNLFSEVKTVIESVEQIRDIYDRLVKEEVKSEDKLDGVLFRKEIVDVVTSTGKTVHRGNYPEESIKKHLLIMINFLNNVPIPMLYKIAISHYYFGYVHPFYDGNGRTSRYISSMYLIDELDKLTALTLSYSTNKSKQFYYDAFSECNDPKNKGELTYFCEVFFQIIHNAQNDILKDLSEKKEKMEQLQELIHNIEDVSDLGRNIVYILGQHIIFGIEGTGMSKKELEMGLEITDYVIRKELKTLEGQGYIKFIKQRPIEVSLSDQLENLLKVDVI
ncbi:Fic family protein [Bacillus infantis]|uniref:Fic family protein n=1 Tax=Bacillus infantis TaxID=324767 RepID=A0A5D4R3M0_9BACI|nr:Fic family protein [Bacillus infantis]TYS45967.1 Fic family protein [Bacillus infantis]